MSRIGAIDLDPDEPTRVLRVSSAPVLDIGRPGAFDDNGVILGDVIEHGGKWLMFYVGFQLVERVKFLAFTGLAASSDGGETFQRTSEVPVLDRSDQGLFFRAIHSVVQVNGRWRAYCGVGSAWQHISGRPYPSYRVLSFEGSGEPKFEAPGEVCFDFQHEEYRLGRPRVYPRQGGGLRMFYTIGTRHGSYLPGYAESNDGKKWIRRDAEAGLQLSPSGWDSTALSYPALIEVGGKTYVFYNGNEMGKTGFGVALLEGA